MPKTDERKDLEQKVKKVIQLTRMNQLVWKRANNDRLTTELDIGDNKLANVTLEREVGGSRVRKGKVGYSLMIDTNGLMEGYKLVRDFGRYMFLED